MATNTTDPGLLLNERVCSNGRDTTDVSWLLSTGMSVLGMQAGFALLESGVVRDLNAVNILYKNVADTCLGGLTYWALGYGLSYGTGIGGFMGTDQFFPDEGLDYEFFFFQFSFAATASTIDSGCVVERMRIHVYMGLSAVMTMWTYPVAAHWVWGGGWLAEMGFLDFAGASVVHMLGGVSGLVCTMWLGPRTGQLGRNLPDDSVMDTEFFKLTLTAFNGNAVNVLFGTLLLFFAWFSFNCGSTLQVSNGGAAQAGKVAFTTMLGACSGGCMGMLLSLMSHGYWAVTESSIGILAGLVTITAAPHVLPAWASVVGGALGCILAIGSERLLRRLKIDDPVGVIPVHLVSGLFGTIWPALVGKGSECGGPMPFDTNGLVYSGSFKQLGIQVLGVTVIAIWSVGNTLLYFFVIKYVFKCPIRIDVIQELVGNDVADHGIDGFRKIQDTARIQSCILGMKQNKGGGGGMSSGRSYMQSSAANSSSAVESMANVVGGENLHKGQHMKSNAVRKLIRGAGKRGKRKRTAGGGGGGGNNSKIVAPEGIGGNLRVEDLDLDKGRAANSILSPSLAVKDDE